MALVKVIADTALFKKNAFVLVLGTTGMAPASKAVICDLKDRTKRENVPRQQLDFKIELRQTKWSVFSGSLQRTIDAGTFAIVSGDERNGLVRVTLLDTLEDVMAESRNLAQIDPRIAFSADPSCAV